MLVMVVFFIAFRWIHLSTPLIRLFLLVLILLLMPTLNVLPVWFALSLLRFRLPSRLHMMFILWMVAMMVVSVLFCSQAEDGIRDLIVTGVQTCALPISSRRRHTRSDRDWSSDVCSSDLIRVNCVCPATILTSASHRHMERVGQSLAEFVAEQ